MMNDEWMGDDWMIGDEASVSSANNMMVRIGFLIDKAEKFMLRP